jgi:hypothetical protein
MNSKLFNTWATFLANVGVIIGLVFLVLEMQQDSKIAIAQARLDYAAAWRSVDGARQEESFAELLHKSLIAPEKLSITEVIRLDAYYWGVVDQMLNAQVGTIAGVRITSFEIMVRHTVRTYFSNRFARSWWHQVREGFSDPENVAFQKVVDNEIAGLNLAGNTNQYEDMQLDLKAHLESSSSR